MLGSIVHDDPRVWNWENPDVCLMINFKVTFFYSKKRTSDPGGDKYPSFTVLLFILFAL